ncbi:MAG: OmpP1/FadL family transporter, partial [Candidatus Binatia bacterium]
TATSSDPSSVYYNPAGLAAIDEPVVWFDLASFTAFGDTKNPRTGERFDFNLDPFVMRPTPILAGPLPWTGLSWGFGILGTAGLATRFPADVGENRFSSFSAKSLQTVLAPAFAWQALPRLSLGVTAEISAFTKFANAARFGDGYFGDALTARTGSEVDTRDGRDDGTFRLETDEDFPSGLRPNHDLAVDFRSASFVAGLQYQLHPRLRVGVVYREKSEPTMRGRARILLDESARAATGLSDLSADSELDVLLRPRQVVSGIAVEVLRGWTVHADGQWSQWGSQRSVHTTFGGEGLLGQKDLVLPFEWHDTFAARVGIEKVFDSGKRLWLGWWLDKDPVPDRTYFAPFIPGDFHVASVGGWFPGLLGEAIDAGAYVQYAIDADRRLEPGESVNAGGLKRPFADAQGRLAFGPNDEPITAENSGVYIIGFTLQYRFGG